MAIINNNSARTITNTADGGDLTASDVQTIEVTPSEVIGTETIVSDNGTVTLTTLSDEVTVRKENGEVRATITRG